MSWVNKGEDIDERDNRSGSFARYNRNYSNDYLSASTSQSFKKDNDVLSILITEQEFSSNVADRDRIELLKRIEMSLKRNPESCIKASRYIAQLFNHPNSSIRKGAYTCALLILPNNKNPQDMILDAYKLAMCSSSTQVAQHAISYLNDFITVCPEESSTLIKFGGIAQRNMSCPSTSIERSIAKSMQFSSI